MKIVLFFVVLFFVSGCSLGSDDSGSSAVSPEGKPDEVVVSPEGKPDEAAVSPEGKLDEANTALDNKDYGTSIAKFSEIYKEDSSNTEAYMGIVNSYVGLMEVETLMQALQGESVDVTALMGLYMIYTAKGYFDSLEVLEEILSETGSPAYENLTPEQQAELLEIKTGVIAGSLVNDVVMLAMTKPEEFENLINGDLDGEVIQELLKDQDPELVNSMIDSFIKSGLLDMYLQTPGE